MRIGMTEDGASGLFPDGIREKEFKILALLGGKTVGKKAVQDFLVGWDDKQTSWWRRFYIT